METLMSARSHLHLSYVGQSQQDNSPLPPSVLVSELLEVIEQGFEAPGREILERIVVRHPLQAFSPDYFRGGDLFSYSEERLRCAGALLEAKRPAPPFVPRDLPEPGPEWLEVGIDDLARFFRNPSAFLLRDRLGLLLEAGADLPDDREPFAIEGLERYKLGQRLVERCTHGEDPWDLYRHAASSGKVPHGPAGRVQFDELAREVTGFVEGTEHLVDGEPSAPLPVNLEIGPFRVTGVLEGIRDGGVCRRRFATIKVKDRLSAWIRHLVLNLVEGLPERSRRSVVVGLVGARSPGPQWAATGFGPVSGAESLLLDLLERYRQGLLRPLPFFPETSWAYVRALHTRNGSEQKALQAARRVYEGSEHIRGDRQEPHAGLCFRNQDPLETEAFRDCAIEVLLPVLEHEETPA
jgi:exodeoxyribonuclease V gamma subunit